MNFESNIFFKFYARISKKFAFEINFPNRYAPRVMTTRSERSAPSTSTGLASTASTTAASTHTPAGWARLTPAKKRVLELIKRSGPCTPAELANELGHTEVALRQHLQALLEEGWVREGRRPAKGRGRPATEWALTEASQALFPDRHGDLTVQLIEAARDSFGDQGLSKLLESRLHTQVELYRRELPGEEASWQERTEALARRRTSEGYMAEVRTATEMGFPPGDASPSELYLLEHHCPICEAARSCVGLCARELELFGSYLGPEVEIERVRHLLAEGDRCVYRIRPVGSASG